MPADALLPCFAMLTWVRLEARPFHIPSRIALLRWFRGFVVDYGGQIGGDDGPLCTSLVANLLFALGIIESVRT